MTFAVAAAFVALALAVPPAAGGPVIVWGSSTFLSLDTLLGVVAENGFRLERHQELTYSGTQRELVDLMRIPAMAASTAPHLSPSLCFEAVTSAARHIELNQAIQVPWTFFYFKREAGELNPLHAMEDVA